MYRVLLRVLGGLELAAALALFLLAYQLPGSAEVNGAAGQIEQIGRKSAIQVNVLRQQVRVVRRQQPELVKLTKQLQKEMESVRRSVKTRTFSADGLETVSAALGQVAEGLDSLATTLDEKGVAQIGKGFGATADLLDEKIVPAAEKAASTLEKAGTGLKNDAGKFSAILKESPLDLKATKSVVDSLAQVEDGLERMTKLFKIENMNAMREGFKGMESSLDGGASQVEKFSNLTIPKVTVKGLRVLIEEKDFWPDGKEIASGMRKAAKGCNAASKEMDALNKEMPRIRTSLDQSRKVVATTKQALASALSRQEKLEPVLQRLPQNLAKLADDLPQLTAELAKMLRETARLKDVASALRQAEKTVAQASTQAPVLRKSLEKSADLLRNTQKQLQGALSQREQYEKTLEQTVELSALFAQSLPVMLEQLQTGLEYQEQSLGELGDSIETVNDSLAPAAITVNRILATARLLLWLVAVIVLVHGGYLIVGAGAGVRS